jgi:hypothetical protein
MSLVICDFDTFKALARKPDLHGILRFHLGAGELAISLRREP